MDPTIFTPRLKLTLVTKAERGSPELEWLHELRSDEKTTWWSIYGQSKTIEDTEKVMKGSLPTGEENTYRVVYAVHKALDKSQGETPTQFIGLVTLRSLEGGGLALPEHLTLPASAATTALTLELAYQFLPLAWGQGYAAESVNAVFDACKRAPSFWSPFQKVYVRAIVNEGNPASLRVMQKTAMVERGVFEWTGRIWLAGGWRERDDLHIFGMWLLE